ncbi:hypothetical protein BCO26_2583 [Heyndrickxia coagulans 2-6]|nr:hypothetical protein BCO26_2583 [Heyndrickxia coagulans 2-6]
MKNRLELPSSKRFFDAVSGFSKQPFRHLAAARPVLRPVRHAQDLVLILI